MEFIGNFFVVASQVVTLFLLMGVGFVLAQLVTLTTLLSVITLPLFAVAAQTISGLV
mgnify:CR=1 FL=1